MTEIKAGQVFKHWEPKERLVVTKVYEDYNDEVIFDVIFNNGDAVSGFLPMNLIEDTPIATYPTWQEAVNSKEFNL